MTQDSFRDFVLEQLSALDGLHCKRMFGGRGLYFKTNPDTLPHYLAFEAAVFTPFKRRVLKNYREVPVYILEDVHTLTTLAHKAARS